MVALSTGYHFAALWLDLFERLDQWARLHQHLQTDELFLALPFAMVLLTYSWRRYREAAGRDGVRRRGRA